MDEHVDDIKRMCDTNNNMRPGGEVLASVAALNTENHNVQLIRQMLLGLFHSSIGVSHRKKVKLSMVHWLPMGKESSDSTQQEQERAEALAALQVEDDEA